MISDYPQFSYTLLSPDFFETLATYQPASTYRDIVREICGPSWEIQPRGFWTTCDPPNVERLVQGWKIHVSGTSTTGEETLRRVAPVFTTASVAFKFCSDPFIVRVCLNKNWPPEQAGKFITAYPTSETQFVRVLDLCHQATKDLLGPCILSDRPFRDSKIVFYRYGEHRGETGLDQFGRRISFIVSPTGERIKEERLPYYRQPDWVNDPVSDESVPGTSGDNGVLLADRYRVHEAIKFSSVGGVYGATDLGTGQSVIVHEARPMTRDAGEGFDARRALHKQGRILQRLAQTGLVPAYIDSFEVSGHLFLVQERLLAQPLLRQSTNVMFSNEATAASAFADLKRTIRQIADGLRRVHDAGIVLRDLTRSNVMVTAESRCCKFVDFEFAFELDADDPPVHGYTPGYASAQQMMTLRPTLSEDYYAFGVLILGMVSSLESGYMLNRTGTLRSLRRTLRDLGLPSELYTAITGLTVEDPTRRWLPGQAMALIESAAPPAGDRFLRERIHSEPVPHASPRRRRCIVERAIEGIAEFITDSTMFDRDDILYPSSAEVFRTNGVQIEFGAAGVVAFLHRIGHEHARAGSDWIMRHIKGLQCPAGLYSGLSGVALVLLELGRTDDAIRVLEMSSTPDSVFVSPNLYYGAAGWGLANLHFWHTLGDSRYLTRAQEVGAELDRTAIHRADGVGWRFGGAIHLGLGHGQSGIATFLFHLNAAAPDSRILDLAVRAMDLEIAYGRESAGAILWHPAVESASSAPRLSHMIRGTAGVGSAAVRAYAATGDNQYREFAVRCAPTISTRFTNKLWQNEGLSGYGEFLLDLYQFTGEERFYETAFYLAEGIVPHRIARRRGFAFLGSQLQRISCDFGYGSAGIGVFLHRLLNPETSRFMMIDSFFVRPVTPGRV